MDTQRCEKRAKSVDELYSAPEQFAVHYSIYVNAPANKNMDTWPRFYSTKKRCQKSKVQLARPTFEEQEAFLKEVVDGKMEKNDSVKINRGMC